MKPPTSNVFKATAIHYLTELEGIPLASFSTRAAAFAIDLIVVWCLIVAIGLPSAFRDRAHNPSGHLLVHFDPFHTFSGVLILLVYAGLGTYLGHGQTLGKRLFHIRVVSVVHSHLTLWHSIERALGYGASTLEFGFGFLQYFIHPNRQTVHDRIAETIVIVSPRQPNGTA